MSDDSDLYELGDLFWAKVGSHPWWPCMIYHPPEGDSHIREKGRSLNYHVQFLGPLVERAWVSLNNLIPFEGKKKFDDYMTDKLKNCRDKNERSKYEFKSTSKYHEIWTKSWKEAELCSQLPKEKRIEKYGRISVDQRSRKLTKTEEAEMAKLLDNVPLTVGEEAESLANYLREESEKRRELDPTVDLGDLEHELRLQWPVLDIAAKRKYLKQSLGIFEDLKATNPVRAAKQSRKSINKSKSDTLSSVKTEKKTEPKAKVISDIPEYDIEIHRLIVSPAQYRFQPVCHVCEVFSSTTGLMLKCRGVCGRVMHPSCLRYKNPPPLDNNRPEKFRCPQCLSGDHFCAICTKPSTSSNPLFACQTSDCGRYYHRSCTVNWPQFATRQQSSWQITACPAHSCNTCWLELEQQGDGSSDPVEDESLVPSRRRSTVTGNKLNHPCCKGPFIYCVRCPAAYHTGDLCTPAGSVEVSLSHIVCPRHFDDQLGQLTQFKPVYPSWCFECKKGGPERIFCSTCPANYHPACRNSSHGIMQGEKFTCTRCCQGHFTRYAQIVWAKIPSFRWWPCEVIHARNAPMNILNMSHPEGSYPVHFLGTTEYQWVAKGRCLPFQLGLSNLSHYGKVVSRTEKAFAASIKRAPKSHQLYVNHVLQRSLPLKSMTADPLPAEELLPMLVDSTASQLPAGTRLVDENVDPDQLKLIMSTFELIDVNMCSTEAKSVLNQKASQSANKSSSRCSCPAGPIRCSLRSNCINVVGKIECTSVNCSLPGTKVDCGNRQFTKAASSFNSNNNKQTMTLMRTINRGYGLKALTVGFKKGSLVAECIGECITVGEANQRLRSSLGSLAQPPSGQGRKSLKATKSNANTIKMTRLTNDLVLDMTVKGSLPRFVNHSCEPNLSVQCWTVDGKPRLGLFANRPIGANEELTIDYTASKFLSSDLIGSSVICLCGTDSCRNSIHLTPWFDDKHDGKAAVSDKQPQPQQSSKTTAAPLEIGFNQFKQAAASSSVDSGRKRKESTSSSATIQQASLKASPPPIADDSSKPSVSSSVSVLNLLAAAKATAQRRRQPKPLIQPRNEGHQIRSVELSTAAGGVDASLYLRPPAHEDFCYRCGDGGELVLCDKKTCPKTFHLSCVGLTSPPSGVWYCPWHFCDQCGRPSTRLCWRCPNSYCDQHVSPQLIRVDDLDLDRWNEQQQATNGTAALSQANQASLVSSCRWLCSDHWAVEIVGPEFRPRLAPVVDNSANNNGVGPSKRKTPSLSDSVSVRSNEGSLASGKKRKRPVGTTTPVVDSKRPRVNTIKSSSG